MKVCEVFSSTEYGYWLSPKGELHAVDVEQHEDWMREELQITFSPTSPTYADDVYKEAYNEGWIRIVTEHGLMVYEGQAQDLRTHLPLFLGLVKETDPDLIIVAKGEGVEAPGVEFNWPAQRGDMIRYIKQA